MGKVLVTGGAGYIGGQTVLSLLDAGYEVCVLDDLSTGRYSAFLDATSFYEGRVHDTALVAQIIAENDVSSILHFAGSIRVDESVENPLKYYENNTEGSRRLIDTAVKNGVSEFIFSSTAAVYGEASDGPVSETKTPEPLNPYGWSKLFTERLLADVAATGRLTAGIYRYFNVAGADMALRHGQYLDNPTHLIGRAIDGLLRLASPIKVFGRDLPTRDGTGVRDYIHVCDVASAHVALLQDLRENKVQRLLNLGYGRGHSVLEVLRGLETVAGCEVPFEDGVPRPGEAPEVVANVEKLMEVLPWRPQYGRMDAIIDSSLRWRRKIKI